MSDYLNNQDRIESAERVAKFLRENTQKHCKGFPEGMKKGLALANETDRYVKTLKESP